MRNCFRKIIAKILQLQVRRLIKAKNPKIVAITGSVGKTFTKHVVARVLSANYRVLVHPGNYNSEIGLPLAIFEADVPKSLMNPWPWLKIFIRTQKVIKNLRYPYEVWVLELGSESLGEIAAFTNYLTPDLGIITSVTLTHLEGYKSLTEILDDEMELATSSKLVLLNQDDVELGKLKAELPVDHIKWYGLDKGEYRFEIEKFDEHKGYRGILHLPGQDIKINTQIIAKHNLYALVVAGAVAKLVGNIENNDIRIALEAVTPTYGRMNFLPGLKGSVIIDDTYNSSPDAAIAALDTLYSLSGRKIAMLGSMNELAGQSKKAHIQVGSYATRADLLITIGQEAKKYLLPAALKAGLKKKQTKAFDDPYAAGEYLLQVIKKGDYILAKGSQNNVFAEEAVALILKNPADRTKLVRQSDQWQKQKRTQLGLQ